MSHVTPADLRARLGGRVVRPAVTVTEPAVPDLTDDSPAYPAYTPLIEQVWRVVWFGDTTRRAELLARLNTPAAFPETAAYQAALTGVLDASVQDRPDRATYERWFTDASLKLKKVDLGDGWSTDRMLVTRVVAGAAVFDNAADIYGQLLEVTLEGEDFDDLADHERGFLRAIRHLLSLLLVRANDAATGYELLYRKEFTPEELGRYGPLRTVLEWVSRSTERTGDAVSRQGLIRAMRSLSFRNEFIVKCLGRLEECSVLTTVMGSTEHTAQLPDKVRLAMPYGAARDEAIYLAQ